MWASQKRVFYSDSHRIRGALRIALFIILPYPTLPYTLYFIQLCSLLFPSILIFNSIMVINQLSFIRVVLEMKKN